MVQPTGKILLVNNNHPLGRLMQDAMDRNDWSLRELERRSEAVGQRMSHTNLGRIKDEPVTSIKGDVIKLLSQILNVPEHVVSAAALESMGVDHSARQDSSTLEEVVRTSQEISEYDQELLGALIQVMKNRASNDSGDNEPQDELRARREGASREGSRPGQKSAGEETFTPPSADQLAAHPYFELHADRVDREFETLGEESQDFGEHNET